MQQLPWILDGDRKLPGRAVAEGSDGAVVVRAAPLAENVRQTVQKNLRTGFCAVAQKDLLGGQLALTVRRGGTGLNGGGEQHRAGTLRQAGEEDFGEVKVPSQKASGLGARFTPARWKTNSASRHQRERRSGGVSRWQDRTWGRREGGGFPARPKGSGPENPRPR